jgi:ABC-type oligopeptide transport system substrate-binding subunit
VGARADLLAGATPQQKDKTGEADRSRQPQRTTQTTQTFGAEALGNHVLRVRLRRADNNFPALVAHSVFRPVKLQDEHQLRPVPAADLVSNGAFLLARTDNNSVLLERDDQYWNRAAVGLDRVHFVGTRDVETTLADYRAGKIDAISNAPLEPLALKLLVPYKDFRRNTYGALTYYSFNTAKPPFDDVRVREALSIAIDRERISRDDLDGATEPARRFLPEAMSEINKPVVDKSELLDQDVKRAKTLLAEAGYPDGEGFPTVRLLINRNEQQRIVAQSVAAMWSSLLNINAEIIMANWDEYGAFFRAGDYHVARRGIVMQTTDEYTNLRMIFRHEAFEPASGANPDLASTTRTESGDTFSKEKLPPPIETEAQALSQLRAMPIYFATSYALVRPYVTGFEANVLDVPSLKTVKIDLHWRKAETARLFPK